MRLIGCSANTTKYLAQVAFRIQSAELGRTYQAVEGSGSFTASVGPGEQIIFASENIHTKDRNSGRSSTDRAPSPTMLPTGDDRGGQGPEVAGSNPAAAPP